MRVGGDIKVFWSCSILLDFFFFFFLQNALFRVVVASMKNLKYLLIFNL